jgi:hypothetical protein
LGLLQVRIMRVIYKTYELCDTSQPITERVDSAIGSLNRPLTYLGYWNGNGWTNGISNFVWSVLPFNAGYTYGINPATQPSGVEVHGFSGADGTIYMVVINKSAKCAFDYQEYLAECCPSLNIVWLNRIGGFQNYIFNGKKQVFEIEEGENETFKTQNLSLKNSQITDVYRGVIVNTGIVPREHLSYLESLRNSIQAWVYDEELPSYFDFQSRFVPIILDRETMVVNDTKEKLVERSVRFLIAKELKIQTQ